MSLHASGTNDPPEVRNWTIHWVALVASMAALACMQRLYLTLRKANANRLIVGYDSAVIGGTMALDCTNMSS